MIWKSLPFPTLLKVDESKHELSAIITAPVEDLDGEVCDTEASWPYYLKVKETMLAASGGQNCLPLRDMHQLVAVGKTVDLQKRADGAIHGRFVVTSEDAWNNVVEGVFTGVSQSGRIVKRYERDGKRFFIVDPMECSLVDRPALPVCTFDYVSRAGLTEIRKFAKGVSMNPDHFLTSARHHEELAGVNAKLARDHNECAELHKKQAEHLKTMATDRSFAELGGGDKAAPSWLKKTYTSEDDIQFNPAGGLRKRG